MNSGNRQEIGRRACAAAAAVAAWVVLSWFAGNVEESVGAAPVFFLVTIICTAIVVLARGLGWLLGLGIGLAAGLAVSAGLASQLSVTGPGLGIFVGLSSFIVCLLGGVAGAAREAARRESGLMFSAGSNRTATLSPARAGTSSRQALMYALANMADDFCAWMDSPGGRACCIESQDCSGFDQFVRTSLRQHLQADCVRVYQLSSDGAWLEPLVRSQAASLPRLPAGEGVVARAVSSGQALIVHEPLRTGAPETGQRAAPQPLAPAARPAGPEASDVPRWQRTPRWLLPLRTGARTEVLVTVARVSVPRANEQRLAGAVRVQLQLFWRQVSALRVLSRHLRTDRQTGMLERIELLNHLDEVVGESIGKPEPVMVLALALEGLRKLDDSGLWRQRDVLIQELGRALRAKIRADDVLGRFSDDRFVIVLRGLESTLATRVAEKLLETVRIEAIQAVVQPPESDEHSQPIQLTLRAGLAGTGPQCSGSPRPFATFDAQVGTVPDSPQARETGQNVLQRALGLVDYARRQRIELATDLMAGVPESLARYVKAAVHPAAQAAATSTDDTDEHQTASARDAEGRDGVSS